MARARTALATHVSQLILLCRALLFNSTRKKQLFNAAALHSESGFTSTQLAKAVSTHCRVSEPSGRRAVRRFKALGLLTDAGNGKAVKLTRLGRAVLGGTQP